MDLGATVCRPRSPLCEVCPLAEGCVARAGGGPETYPRRTAKADRPHRHGVAFLLTRGGEVAMLRRPPKGLLGGMLGLPGTPWRSAPWTIAEALAHAPASPRWREAGRVGHVFTHFSLNLLVLTAEVTASSAPGDVLWTPLGEAAAAAPSLFRKALDLAA
jgi:A/G-specific adenine glycosylase